MPITILIVEDDPHIAHMIEATLSMAGYNSMICPDGTSAIRRILTEKFDLVLLDIMLPEADGFTVMEHVQPTGVPVIFLTAMQDTMDKVRGLRLGAEDYIVKPFEAMELLARIEVVLRRTHRAQTILSYGNITIDTDRHRVEQDGVPVDLRPKEYELLVFFVQNQDIAITREQLLDAVWGYGYDGETRTVDVQVQTMRRKLHLKNKLVTLPKLGYRLERQS